MAFTESELNEMAVLAIFNYFCGKYTKEYILANFKLAIKILVENASTNRPSSDINSVSENGTSITYNGNYRFSMTDDVLSLLPKKNNLSVW